MTTELSNKYTELFKKYKKISYPSVGIVILIISYQIGVLFSLTELESTKFNVSSILTNLVSIIGSIASIVGLFIAYVQIQEIKKQAARSEEIVTETNSKISKALSAAKNISSVSNISTNINIVKNIQEYIFTKEYKAAIIRMKDLKPLLIELNTNVSSELPIDTELNRVTSTLGINIHNIHSSFLNEELEIDYSIVINDLENLETKLIEIQQKILNKSYVQ